MESVPAWLVAQGWPGVCLLVLGGFFLKVWNAREKCLEKREADIRAIADALNASTQASIKLAESVEAISEATAEFSGLAATRAVAFDEFRRDMAEFVRRADLALQRLSR